MTKEIPKTYDPKAVEDRIYAQWEESGFFNPDNLPGERSESFSIMMPPPNATGTLHVGHAVMLAIEDTIIRFQRMTGKKALWLPGTDHAAIATQSKVERLLKEQENKTKHDLGREGFLQKIHEYVEGSRSTIKNQVKKIGSSCDWSRERFTLDENLNIAVNEAFKRMYDDGLIYRGNRIVNWDPKMQTTVSDDEIEYIERPAKFYYFKYGPFEIGTARPETKFGDKYVVMHPADERYKNYQHGQTIELEWINGPITATIIKDEAVDMEFGTGAMTITPWHSAVDFDLSQKHNLDVEQIIDFEGKLLPVAGEFAGMLIQDAREKIVEKLQAKGLLVRVDETYINRVGTNSRGGGIIEPQIKEQWFVDVNKSTDKLNGKTLKERALEVVKNGEIDILPERFEKIYFHWLENLRDWCISRQIWYGHQVPVWYRKKEIVVGTKPEGEGWQQDTDTLDTWFSSGIWTFSTLGWPNQTKDLKTFHPTNVLETGYDIIFFWVARMIIMSTYLMGDIPFKTVYLHGLVRDEQGRKMSKSLDNIIDPLDTIKDYGADATRLSLLIGSTPGNDSNISVAKIAGYRNFVNKLWNISRYVLTQVENPKIVKERPKPKTLADEWILSELDELVSFATKNIAEYNLSIVGERIYEFTWSKLADWYLEIAKVEKNKDEILLYVLQNLLKLWHPFTPFITENIWAMFNPESLLIVEDWPKADKNKNTNIGKFNLIKEVITAIRIARSDAGVAPALKIPALLIAKKDQKLLEEQKEIISALARLSELDIKESGEKPEQSIFAVVGGVEIYLSLSGTIDIDKQKAKLEKEIEELSRYIITQKQKLDNQQFVKNAPKNIIDVEKNKLAEAENKSEALKAQLALL